MSYYLQSGQPLNDKYQPLKKNDKIILSIDDAQILCGNGHKYQLKAIFVSTLQYLFASIMAAGWPLLFQNPTFYCYTDISHTEYQECDRRDACNLIYEGQNKDAVNYFVDRDDEYFNLTEQYELYCKDNAWIYNTTQIFILGGVIGSLYFSIRMEQAGRLRVLNESMSLMILTALVSYFCFNIYIFAGVAFIFDFGFRGFNNASQILISEQTGVNLRRMLPSLLMIGWALGQIIISLVSYYYFNWRNLQLVLMGVPLLILYFNQTTLQDSPRFLLVQRKFQDAINNLLTIAKKNNKEVEPFKLQEEAIFEKQKETELKVLNNFQAKEYEESQYKGHSFLSIFYYKSIRSKTFSLMYIWGVTTLSYYILLLEQQKYVEKQLQFHLIIAGIFDLVSYLLYMNLSLSYFRKSVIKYVLVLLGIGHLLFFIIPMYSQDQETEDGKIVNVKNYNLLAIYLFCFLRVLICGFSNSFLYVYIGEIYPTSVRHYAYGFFTAWTKGTWILGPILTNYFNYQYPSLQPLSFIGILLLLGVYLVRKLRETMEEEETEDLNLVQNKVKDYLEEEETEQL